MHYSLLSLKLGCQKVFIKLKFYLLAIIIIRKDRKAGGGGVLLAIDNRIATKPLTSPNNIEVVTVRLLQGQSIIISVVYNPPNTSDQYYY